MVISKFNSKIGILETKFEGKVSVKDMLDYIFSIRKNSNLPSILKIYSDATDAKFEENVSRKDLEKFLEENRITLAQKAFVYDAFVISSTFETALGMLYRELNKIDNYKFEVFSTKEAGIEWLNKF
jgi:hypothetical protein